MGTMCGVCVCVLFGEMWVLECALWKQGDEEGEGVGTEREKRQSRAEKWMRNEWEMSRNQKRKKVMRAQWMIKQKKNGA